ncbi:MAG: Hpt domain-containing protein [Candidatus Sericytochromatia bacterium]
MFERPIIDPEVQARIYAVGGDALFSEMLHLFLSQIEHYSQAIESDLARHDYPSLEAHLHAMKSAASSLGFIALESCLKGFERATQAHSNWGELCLLAEQWRKSVSQASDCAEQLLNAN